MKKKFLTVISVVMLLAIVAGTGIAASTTKNLATGFTLVNLDVADADVVVDYFKETTGGTWTADPGNSSFSIPGGGGSVQIKQYFDSTLTAGRGSAVVSSSTPLGSLVQILARSPQVPTRGAYTGFSLGSNKFYIPLVSKYGTSGSGTVNSQIIVQNIESTPQDVTVQLFNSDGSSAYIKSIPALPANASFYYDLADESGSNLPSGWFGSAVVNAAATKQVTAVVNNFLGADGLQSFSAFPIESLSSKWMVPLFLSRLANKLTTVVSVQNLSGGAIAPNGLTLACKHDPSRPTLFDLDVKNTATINDKAKYEFNSFTDTVNFPTEWYGSCTVDAGSANVVAFVQLRYVGAGSNGGTAAYEALSAAKTDKKMYVPLVLKRLPNGFATVVTIQNMSSSVDASITLTYTPDSALCPVSPCDISGNGTVGPEDSIVVSKSIPAGTSLQRNHRINGSSDAETAVPDNWTGSLVVVSTTSAINGFTQITDYLNPVGDTFMTFDNFTLP